MIMLKIVFGILAVICIVSLVLFFKEVRHAPLVKDDEEELLRRLNG